MSHSVVTTWDPTRMMILRMRMKKDGEGCPRQRVPSPHQAWAGWVSNEPGLAVAEPTGRLVGIWVSSGIHCRKAEE